MIIKRASQEGVTKVTKETEESKVEIVQNITPPGCDIERDKSSGTFFGQSGQIVIVMLLTMLVALSIGLVVTQRSITDVTTSTQTEQASRAFSAAEAGIEKALTQGSDSTAVVTVSPLPEAQLGNQSEATDIKISPDIPTANDQALEYPPIGRDSVAHFWLASPVDPLTSSYIGNTVDIYFGNSGAENKDPPAVEVNVVTNEGGVFTANKYFLDTKPRGDKQEGFSQVSTSGIVLVNTFNPATFDSQPSKFYAKATVNVSKTFSNCTLPSCYPVLARVRVLYSETSQKVALGPALTQRLPAQANYYSSTGKAGQSQKTIVVFRQKNVVPQYLDFALFSLGNITKE